MIKFMQRHITILCKQANRETGRGTERERERERGGGGGRVESEK